MTKTNRTNSELAQTVSEDETSCLKLLKSFFHQGFLENSFDNKDWWHHILTKVLGTPYLYFINHEILSTYPEIEIRWQPEEIKLFSQQLSSRSQGDYRTNGHPFFPGELFVFSLHARGSGGHLLIDKILEGSVLENCSQNFLHKLHDWILFTDLVLYRCTIADNPIHQKRLESLERTLEKMQHELTYSQQEGKYSALRHLAGGLAHEFNNQMSIILGHIEFAQNQSNPAIRDKTLKLTYDTCSRMRQTINRLLTFSEKKPLHPQETDLNQLAVTIVDSLIAEAQERDIAIKTDLKPLPLVWVDQEGFKEVIKELLLNALHASKQKTSVTLSTRQVLNNIELLVIDHGEGISPHQLHEVYEPYFTSKGALGGGIDQGNGLGLSTTHTIISQHKGKPLCFSLKDQGSLFGFSLPIKDTFLEDLQLKTKDIKILVIESREPQRQRLGQLLKAQNFQVEEAAQGIAALNHIDQWNPHLLLVSAYLSDMEGVELIETIHSYVGNLPTILISDEIQPSLIRQASRLGLNHFLDWSHLENSLIEEVRWTLKERHLLLDDPLLDQKHLSTKPLNILIIDDEPNIGALLKRYLESLRHKVTTLTKPQLALDVMKSRGYDLVFIDLVMPFLNGVDLTREIRRQGHTQPIVWMSGFKSDENPSLIKELHISHTLHKPFQMNLLNSVLKDVESASNPKPLLEVHIQNKIACLTYKQSEPYHLKKFILENRPQNPLIVDLSQSGELPLNILSLLVTLELTHRREGHKIAYILSEEQQHKLIAHNIHQHLTLTDSREKAVQAVTSDTPSSDDISAYSSFPPARE